jgi:tetratricopeptide (TPR) repeat protein
MFSRFMLAAVSIPLMLAASLTSSAAQAGDSSLSACNSVVDRAVSQLSSAATRPDSLARALQSLEGLKEQLTTNCAAAAKDAHSGVAQCEHVGGKWDAGQGKCQNLNNNKVEIFGGTVEQVTLCWNQAIFLRLADGTSAVWTPDTNTFKRGAASHARDFVVGITDKDYYCLAQKLPIIVWAAPHIKALAHRPYRSDDDPQRRADSAAAHARAIDELNKKIASYTRQIKAAPDDASILSRRGNTYLEKYEYADAIADFNQVVALRPSDAGAWSNRCWARAIANLELAKGLSDAIESLRLKPNAVDALNCRGLISLRLGHVDEAISDYDSVLGIGAALREGGNWDIPSAWYGRGLAERQRRNEIAGILDFAAATAVAPTIADQFAAYGFNTSGQSEVYGQKNGDMNPILMAPLFDSYLEAFYKAVSENGRPTASKLTNDAISGMLEAATLSLSDFDTRKICGNSPLGHKGQDTTSQSLSCFFLVLDQATKKYAPEQDIGKYQQLIRGAIYGLENSTH